MKKVYLLFLLFVSFHVNAQLKVVGYLPTYHWDKLASIDFSHLTHVCAAFANPDESGKLSFEKDIDIFVNFVHRNGASALISICGGGDYSWGEKYKVYEKLLETPTSRTAFVKKIMNYVRKHHLNGVDNDMEGKALELANYNIFSQELGDSLHQAGLVFSAALGVDGQWGVDILTKKTMETYDFIMTMSYGNVGNWNWSTKPDLGTLLKMKKDIQHILSRGYDTTKVLGGLPFYAVEFPSHAHSTYWQFHKSICDIYEEYAAQKPLLNDTIYSSEKHPIYLNSLHTLYQKIDIAITNNSGFMIWELGQDCFGGDVSLMDKLGTYMDEKKVMLNVSALQKLVSISYLENQVNVKINDIKFKKVLISNASQTDVFSSKKRSFTIGKELIKNGTYTLKVIISPQKVLHIELPQVD